MKQLDCLGFYSLWVTELWFKPGELWFKSPCSLHSWLYNMWQSPPTPPHPYKGSRGVGGRQGGREGWIPAPAQETMKKWKCSLLSPVWLSETPQTVARQAPLSMGFSRQEYWSGLPFPSPGTLPHPSIEPQSPALQADSLLSEPPGKPRRIWYSL